MQTRVDCCSNQDNRCRNTCYSTCI